MVLKIQKWGNSLGLRIPKAFAEETDLHDGSAVNLVIENGKLAILPVCKRKLRLSRLLAQINRNNLHAEIIVGEPAGAELW